MHVIIKRMAMKFPYLLPFFALFVVSCSEQVVEADCPSLICTQEFRTVSLRFEDASGQPITIKDFSAIIRRTGKSTQAFEVDTVNFKGNYAVVTDSDTKNLSPKGDTIDVSAVNPKTNQKKSTSFVVSGGKCACHIEKISGPEKVVFE